LRQLREEGDTPSVAAKIAPAPKALPVGYIPGMDPTELSRSAQKNKARREKKKQQS